MKTITLSGIERIKLEGMIGAQRIDNLARVALLYRLREKIRLTDSERSALNARQLPDGREMFDRQSVERLEEKKIELEDAEADGLAEVFHSWTEWTVEDWLWAGPLYKKIEALNGEK